MNAASASLLVPTTDERRRQIRSRLVTVLAGLAAVLALVPLVSIVVQVVVRGLAAAASSAWAGDAGASLGRAALGSLGLVAAACAIGVPLGVGAGIYLAEIGRGRLARAVRSAADALGGAPSVAVGVFVFAIVVVPTRRFSTAAGALALAILLVPIVTRASEDHLRRVPLALREAALGLGVPAWRVTVLVALRTALPGIGAGIAQAIARALGEAAPLLFTAFACARVAAAWPAGFACAHDATGAGLAVDGPGASLPVLVAMEATSPLASVRAEAWTAALVLVVFAFAGTVGARMAATTRRGGGPS